MSESLLEVFNLANFKVGYCHLLTGSSLSVLESRFAHILALYPYQLNDLPARTKAGFYALAAMVMACVFLSTASLSQAPKRGTERPDPPREKETPIVTLNECWRYRSNDLLALKPAVDTSNLYLAENGGRVSAVSLSSGVRLWSTDLGGEIRSNVAVQGSQVFVATSDASKHLRLRALSTASGIPTMEIDLPYADILYIASADGKLVVAEQTGYVAVFAAGSQKPDWQTMVPGIDISNMVIASDQLIAPAAERSIRVISLADGKTVSSTTLDTAAATLGLFDGNLVAGDSRGNLIRYNDDHHTIYWRLRNGARMSGIVATVKGVLAASLDNFVYMVSGYYGDIRWKRRMPGRVASIVTDGDIAIVQTIGESDAVILNLESGKPAGQLSIGDDSFTQPAMAGSGGKFLFFTTGQVIAESAGVCSQK